MLKGKNNQKTSEQQYDYIFRAVTHLQGRYSINYSCYKCPFSTTKAYPLCHQVQILVEEGFGTPQCITYCLEVAIFISDSQEMKKDSLLNTDIASDSDEQRGSNANDPNQLSKKMIGLLITTVAISVIVFVIALASNQNDGGTGIVVPPIRISLALPPQTPFQILLGETRVIEVLFFSGHDDRTSDEFQSVTDREVTWSVDPAGVVEVDVYGRLGTLSAGKATVRVQSKKHLQIFAERTVEVIAGAANFDPLPKRVINFAGTPAGLNPVQQKVVSFLTLQEASDSLAVPQSIKDVIQEPGAPRKLIVKQEGGAEWSIVRYADKSNRTYIKRQNLNEENPRDWIMHMMGNRYVPGDGVEVHSIEDDGENGLWSVNSHGVSHIALETLPYAKKAQRMADNTAQYISRHGLVSSSTLKDGKWVPSISDNDGLWTSLFAAGEFMRYSVLKAKKIPDEEVKKVRQNAFKSLLAVLLTSNIAMRDATVEAKLRHYTNTLTGHGEKLSPSFLKQGKPYAVDTYVGSSADGEGFFGVDAGKTVNGAFYGGKLKYSFQPFHKGDWTENKNEPAATSKRNLKGFMARTFVIVSKDGTPPNGLFFRHNENGTQTVLSGADFLYDYAPSEHPVLNLGNAELPQILKDFLAAEEGEGKSYNRSDLIYKGDTSTDEVIGHLFIYKIAFDILDETDPYEKELKQLIKTSMVDFCTCLTNNDYTMVDATGQGTSWGKMTHTFMSSDETLEDAPLKSLELLLSFKLCHYVSGDPRWQQESQFLIEDPSFRYLDLVAAVWQRWTYRAFNEDPKPSASVYHLDPAVTYSDQEVLRHIIVNIHFSDEEEAFLAFYLIFQLEESEEHLRKFREGLEGWWHSASRSENPLWYYIYQLAYPNERKKDHYGNYLIETASWQLSRHPVDTTQTTAFIEGSREDVMMEGKEGFKTFSTDPQQTIGRRLLQSDSKFSSRAVNYQIADDYDPMNIYEFKILPADERSLHKFNGATFTGINSGNPSSMESCTLFTLPYWMGVYHNMLAPDSF